MPPVRHEVAPERPLAASGLAAKGLALQSARRLDRRHIATTRYLECTATRRAQQQQTALAPRRRPHGGRYARTGAASRWAPCRRRRSTWCREPRSHTGHVSEESAAAVRSVRAAAEAQVSHHQRRSRTRFRMPTWPPRTTGPQRGYAGSASTMLTADAVGTTRFRRKPALASSDAYSASVRSCPPGNTSMTMSSTLPG